MIAEKASNTHSMSKFRVIADYLEDIRLHRTDLKRCIRFRPTETEEVGKHLTCSLLYEQRP